MSGAVIVTTPQNVALADVLRGVNMFRNPQVNKPIYGFVENMSWFTPEAHPEEKYYLFGKDGGTKMAQELEIPLLGQIPLVQGIREGGDSGEPVALGTRPPASAGPNPSAASRLPPQPGGAPRASQKPGKASAAAGLGWGPARGRQSAGTPGSPAWDSRARNRNRGPGRWAAWGSDLRPKPLLGLLRGQQNTPPWVH